MKMEDVASKPENIRRDGRAPNHVASKLKVGIIAGTRAWYFLQISNELIDRAGANNVGLGQHPAERVDCKIYI